jgi:hypothetical protein
MQEKNRRLEKYMQGGEKIVIGRLKVEKKKLMTER